MNLIELLEQNKEKILQEANAGLERAHLTHYERAGSEIGQQRLRMLYELVLQSVKGRNLKAISDYVAQIAQERFAAGYDLYEVQVAFNVLEEACWKQIIAEVPATELAQALGLVGTVHGAAKDKLAVTYVSLASQTKSPSLNLMALFQA